MLIRIVTEPQSHQATRLRYFALVTCCLCVMATCNFAYALDLDQAKIYFLKGDYAQSINECENLLAHSQYSRNLDELYYILGLSYLKQGNFLRASDIFEIIIKEFKDSNFNELAMLGLGDVLFLKADYENAASKYQQIMSSNPRTNLSSLLFFKLAQVSLKRGNWQEAQGYLGRLNKEYPLSFEARMAKNLPQQEFYFTVQVGAFSNLNNAKKLCQKLLDQGYSAYIHEPQPDEPTSFRVRVGRLESFYQAKELEQKLANEGYPTRIYP